MMDVKNTERIKETLNSIAHPSIKKKNNKIYIYSGKFQDKKDASNLLLLTKGIYKNASLASCDGAKAYRGEVLFNKKVSIQSNKNAISYEKQVKGDHFCIKVLELSLSQSVQQQAKINRIIKELPNSKTTIKNNKFYIYTGKFTSKDNANIIAKVLKNEYKNVAVSKCVNHKNIQKKNISKPKMKIYSNNVNSKNLNVSKFSILNLDDKGYLSRDIKSNANIYKKGKSEKFDLQQAFDSQREEYFNGLYLKTNTAIDVQNNDPAYDIRLEFDIFKEGYYANKKKNDKNRIENKINFYRTMQHIEVLKKDQELLKTKRYENSINVSSLLLKLRIAEISLKQADEKLASGVITNFEFEDYKLRVQKIKDELLLFRNMRLLKVPNNLWILLNDIENTRLVGEARLLQKLQEESIDLKLTNALEERPLKGDEWTDKLKLNVYAGVRKMYLAQEQTLIGVEAKIPLSNYSQTRELKYIQNKIMSEHVTLQSQQSEEKMRDAVASFKYKQQRLKTYAYELSNIKKHLGDLQTMQNSSYESISVEAQRQVTDRFLEIYTKIQIERISTYKELVNIMYIIHANDIHEILEYALQRH